MWGTHDASADFPLLWTLTKWKSCWRHQSEFSPKDKSIPSGFETGTPYKPWMVAIELHALMYIRGHQVWKRLSEEGWLHKPQRMNANRVKGFIFGWNGDPVRTCLQTSRLSCKLQERTYPQGLQGKANVRLMDYLMSAVKINLKYKPKCENYQRRRRRIDMTNLLQVSVWNTDFYWYWGGKALCILN